MQYRSLTLSIVSLTFGILALLCPLATCVESAPIKDAEFHSYYDLVSWIPRMTEADLRWQVVLPTFSPDKSKLAVSRPGEQLECYSTQDHKLLWTYKQPNGFAWSPDSKHVVFADDDGVCVLNASAGKVANIYHGLSSRVLSPEYSPDGKYIAAIGFSKRIRAHTASLQVWNAQTNKMIFEKHDGPATGVKWSPEGNRVAVNGSSVWIWDVFSNKEIARFTIPSRGWPPFAWSPNGKFVVVGDPMGNQATIYDAGTGAQIAQNKFSVDISHLLWLEANQIWVISDKSEKWILDCDPNGNPVKKQIHIAVLGENGYIPQNLEECLVQLDAELSPEIRKQMKDKANKKDMISYHLGLGTWMRNTWGLRGQSKIAHLFSAKGIRNSEEISGIIFEAYWGHLHGQKVNLEELISKTKEEGRLWRLQQRRRKQSN